MRRDVGEHRFQGVVVDAAGHEHAGPDAVGDEEPRELIRDFLCTARTMLDPVSPGFSDAFPSADAIDLLCDDVYLEIHRRHAAAKTRFTATGA